ncbi:hypothetical protein FY534_07980 [Alicyclobacillus sp. TC]|uniref:Holin n=1 Tax=Alicyclobacillus tolerans TaxID=90970 RepID=A0ABT9LXG0_9BACL|nr:MULTISPECIES: hypothetical protein [Alicyclobacillus]MDP9728963.1 hypothetical protein [Alicyclobacillus tengchongensis]QRF23616.1 hypothetical protein FY534_07980 [Alicyclobacillus sp. TC]
MKHGCQVALGVAVAVLVLPEWFSFCSGADIWIPISLQECRVAGVAALMVGIAATVMEFVRKRKGVKIFERCK